MSSAQRPVDTLSHDGERFIPGEMAGSTELEHWHRYFFASQVVSDKTVLDIACGEGYGSALLARSARWVTGVDIAEIAVEHARRRYTADNLEFLTGSCTAIPLGDHTVDVVVSFETIEHHAEHEAMMREITRVLRPGGLLVISSPDKLEYSEKPAYHNPFHVKELHKEEFESLLATHFRNVTLLGQRVVLGSMLLGQQRSQPIRFQRHEPQLPAPRADLAPVYWVALASNDELPSCADCVYEQSITELWAEVSRQRNSYTTRLIRSIATPASTKLRTCLENDWYLDRNVDVLAAGRDPSEHWMTTGAAEGRLPSSDPPQLVEELLREREELLREDFRGREQELESERGQSVAAAERKLVALATEGAERERLLREDKQRLQEHLQHTQRHASDILEQSQQREQQLRENIQHLQLTLGQSQAALERVRKESQEQASHAQGQAARAQEQFDRQRADLQEELARARREAGERTDSLLRELAARERALADQLAQQRAELDEERRRQADATDHKVEKIAAEHASRQRESQQDLQHLREQLERTEREANERIGSLLREQAARERALAEQVQAQLQHSLDTEQAFAGKLLEQQAGFNEQLEVLTAEAAQRDLHLREELVSLHERWARALAAERSLLQEQYSRALLLFKTDLEELQASMSWRLTAPVRAIAAAFGSRTALPRTEQIDSLIRLPAHKGD